MNYFQKATPYGLQILPDGLYLVTENDGSPRAMVREQDWGGVRYTLRLFARIRPPYDGVVPPGVTVDERPDGKVIMTQWVVMGHRTVAPGDPPCQ